jgi:hypothetical protein
MNPWISTCVGFWFSVLASAWVYTIVRLQPLQLSRVLASLPIIACQLAITPFLVDYTVVPALIVPVMGIYSLAAFKVAAYALGRGPLMLMDHEGFAKFWAVVSMPVIPRAVFHVSGGNKDVSSEAPANGRDFLYMYSCKAAGKAFLQSS